MDLEKGGSSGNIWLDIVIYGGMGVGAVVASVVVWKCAPKLARPIDDCYGLNLPCFKRPLGGSSQGFSLNDALEGVLCEEEESSYGQL